MGVHDLSYFTREIRLRVCALTTIAATTQLAREWFLPGLEKELDPSPESDADSAIASFAGRGIIQNETLDRAEMRTSKSCKRLMDVFDPVGLRRLCLDPASTPLPSGSIERMEHSIMDGQEFVPTDVFSILMTAGALSWIVLVSRPAEILYLACILRFMHAQSWSVGALAVRTSYDIPQGSVRHSGMQGIRWYDSRRAVDEGIRHCDHHVRDSRLGSGGTLTLTPRTLERPPDRCSASPDTRVVDCKWVYVLKGPCARCGDMTSAGVCANDVLVDAGNVHGGILFHDARRSVNGGIRY